MTKDEFMQEYLGEFNSLDVDLEKYRVCGECKYWINHKCSTSMIAAKYGNGSTPACSEFEISENR